MITNPAKAKLKAGEPLVGVFVSVESPATVEILALAGVDYIMVDGEHTPVTPWEAISLFRAADAQGVSAYARIGENTQQVIAKFMDAGCAGVMMPMVNSGADAKRVVDAVKYPPLGRRGLAGVRANDWGMGMGMGEYVAEANERSLVMVQIETNEGIANADDIINTPGVDAVFLGPSDLSVAFGVPGQTKHPKVLEAIESLTKRINAKGLAAGTIARDPAEYAYWRKRGVQILMTGANAFLASAAKAYLEGARAFEEGR